MEGANKKDIIEKGNMSYDRDNRDADASINDSKGGTVNLKGKIIKNK